jgi:hypothetical protein
LLVLSLRELKGELFYLKLPLEQIHGVLLAGVGHTMDGYAILINREGHLANFIVQSVNIGVDFAFKHFNTIFLSPL